MPTLNQIFCAMFGVGTAGSIVSVVAGFAVFLYFMSVALNESGEGGATPSGAIQIVLLISALTSIANLVNALFGVAGPSCGGG